MVKARTTCKAESPKCQQLACRLPTTARNTAQHRAANTNSLAAWPKLVPPWPTHPVCAKGLIQALLRLLKFLGRAFHVLELKPSSCEKHVAGCWVEEVAQEHRRVFGQVAQVGQGVFHATHVKRAWRCYVEHSLEDGLEAWQHEVGGQLLGRRVRVFFARGIHQHVDERVGVVTVLAIHGILVVVAATLRHADKGAQEVEQGLAGEQGLVPDGCGPEHFLHNPVAHVGLHLQGVSADVHELVAHAVIEKGVDVAEIARIQEQGGLHSSEIDNHDGGQADLPEQEDAETGGPSEDLLE